MLKKVFVSPDPGRSRLRFAARAVLGSAPSMGDCLGVEVPWGKRWC